MEAYELAKRIYEDGLTLFTVIAILGFIITIYESRRKRIRYERMEGKIDLLIQERGIAWNGQPDELQAVLMSLKRWQRSYSADAYLEVLRRRGSKMNKAWLVTLVTYILAQIAIRTGVSIPTEAANWIVDGLMLLIPIALAFMSKTKKPEVPDDGSSKKYTGDGPAV